MVRPWEVEHVLHSICSVIYNQGFLIPRAAETLSTATSWRTTLGRRWGKAWATWSLVFLVFDFLIPRRSDKSLFVLLLHLFPDLRNWR